MPPVRPRVSKEMHRIYFAKGVLATTAIEGNTLLDRLATWINEMPDDLWPDWTHPTDVVMAIIKAVIAHLYIAWIHPFGDGNGRTARLVEFRSS